MGVKQELKVFFQRPPQVSDSPYYKYLLDFAPANIKYSGNKKTGLIISGKTLKSFSLFKQLTKRILIKLNVTIPNAYKSKINEEVDLIHCSNCLSKNKTPWVADMEYGRFWIGGKSEDYKYAPKSIIRKYINSKYCKKILPWSNWSKRRILSEFPEIENKIEVVYPSIPTQKFKKNKNSKKIKILFIGRDFETKGGKIAVEVLDNITKRYDDIEGVVISDTPKEILDKYIKNKKIKFMNLVNQKELFKNIYPSADIFLYPTFSDTFGFAILEAQSFGLPVLVQKTRSTHTVEETIEDGKTGFIVDNISASGENKIFSEKTVLEFIGSCEKLIKDRSLRQKMSNNCINQIKIGKFSMDTRNKKLEGIYMEAIKK
jgi:glycosyltransferase involved in cell wall biosynthesis